MAHGADDPAFGEGLVPLDVDLSDLYLGAFLHNKNQLDRVGGGDALVGGLDHGKLTPALAQQLPEDDLCLLDPGRIELAFHREPDLAVLEALQDFRLRDRLGALVLDAADDGPLFHIEHDDRSEEHTSELQSLAYLVCRLLLEKKKQRDGAPPRTELSGLHQDAAPVRAPVR